MESAQDDGDCAGGELESGGPFVEGCVRRVRLAEGVGCEGEDGEGEEGDEEGEGEVGEVDAAHGGGVDGAIFGRRGGGERVRSSVGGCGCGGKPGRGAGGSCLLGEVGGGAGGSGETEGGGAPGAEGGLGGPSVDGCQRGVGGGEERAFVGASDEGVVVGGWPDEWDEHRVVEDGVWGGEG